MGALGRGAVSHKRGPPVDRVQGLLANNLLGRQIQGYLEEGIPTPMVEAGPPKTSVDPDQ